MHYERNNESSDNIYFSHFTEVVGKGQISVLEQWKDTTYLIGMVLFNDENILWN